MPTPYEKARLENIKRNRELLLALGLDNLKEYVPQATTKKEAAPTAKSRKRKSPPVKDEEDEDESGGKVSKTRAAQDITNTSGARRSARNAGKVVDYKKEVVTALPEVISTAAKSAKNSEGKGMSERRHSPYVDPLVHGRAATKRSVQPRKQYGDIPDVEVCRWWPTR